MCIFPYSSLWGLYVTTDKSGSLADNYLSDYVGRVRLAPAASIIKYFLNVSIHTHEEKNIPSYAQLNNANMRLVLLSFSFPNEKS